MERETVTWLMSTQGRDVLGFVMAADHESHLRAARGDATAADPLRLAQATANAFPDLDRTFAAAALTQVRLRRTASARLGPMATDLLYTRDGLEQASRTIVAQQRAARFRAADACAVAGVFGLRDWS